VGKEVGRPAAGAGQKLAALGFLLAGIGLFVIPHNAGLSTLIAEASTAGAEDHARAQLGQALGVAGLLAVAVGAALSRKDSTA
jgi:hypothetical protein